MTISEFLRDQRADRSAFLEARRQYDRAIEHQFIEAHRAVAAGYPDQAEAIARDAVRLRMDAHDELVER